MANFGTPRIRICRRVGVGVAITAATLLGAGCASNQPLIISYAGHFRPNPTATIRPTAIVIHWWGGTSGGRGVNSLVGTLNAAVSCYPYGVGSNCWLAHPPGEPHHGSVQLATLQDGRTYQLTYTLDTRASHAACANDWAIGNEIEGGVNGTSADMINNAVQFKAVVDTTALLMTKFHIPLNGPLSRDGKSGIGVHSHKEVDANCRLANGVPGGGGKVDVDDAYMQKLRNALRARGL